jgi:hypothetical protein
MKPICVACRRFYRPLKNGVWFLEGMPKDNSAYPGTIEPEMWSPYKLWRGDLWRCEGCGHQTISGVAREPLREHYMPDFAEVVRRLEPILQVNDC